jgi:hypothetical protein
MIQERVIAQANVIKVAIRVNRRAGFLDGDGYKEVADGCRC